MFGYNLMAQNQALAHKSLACCHLRPSQLSCEGLSLVNALLSNSGAVYGLISSFRLLVIGGAEHRLLAYLPKMYL